MSKKLGRSFIPRIVTGSHQRKELPLPQHAQECGRSIPYGVYPRSPHDEHWLTDRPEILKAWTVSKAGIDSSPHGRAPLPEPGC